MAQGLLNLEEWWWESTVIHINILNNYNKTHKIFLNGLNITMFASSVGACIAVT